MLNVTAGKSEQREKRPGVQGGAFQANSTDTRHEKARQGRGLA